MNDRLVLDAVTLDIGHAPATCILGRSGAGKSTLLRVLNRLNECMATTRTTGTIEFCQDGQPLPIYADGLPLPLLRRRVGMVFQHPAVLPGSIEHNMIMPLITVHGLGRQEARDTAVRALKDVRLWPEVHDRLGTPAASLSGGQQQRLCLARSLALQPQVLLLDEPTASLDAHAAQGIEELLETLSERLTLVIVTHNLDFAVRLAGHVVVLRDGRIVADLEADAAITAEELGRLY